ncbi:MAG: MauE/DoxX family redox-associated membrane protein [Bacteroidota bacterium]
MKKILLYLQVVFYIVAGINHFRNPVIYYTLIPPYFPSHPILNTCAGITEIILGSLLLFNSTRKWAAYGIILMLLAFIPAHIYHIQMKGCLPGLCFPEWAVWLRLFLLHPILIAWAWWYRK